MALRIGSPQEILAATEIPAAERLTSTANRRSTSSPNIEERIERALLNALCGTDLRPYGAHTPDRPGFPRLKPWAMPCGRSAAMHALESG